MTESETELRRIRIALESRQQQSIPKVIAVFLFFGSCGNQETVVDTDHSDYEIPQTSSFPLDHNHFGVYEDGTVKIYKYDESKNEVTLKKEWLSDELE
ncbi:YmzC family protein [Bacillus atrophaeus]|uniref:YmzC family protein n=1 Tax=Bacillus atrophaeus TaxID=1452 RepID=UPI0007C52FCA|nr:YmzC family protein [Bacillus atrophaeus]WFE16139.1 YmzC family protein [Bacillus atrophaeus]